MKITRIIALLMAGVMSVGILGGCSDKKEPAQQPETKETAEQAEEQKEQPEDKPEQAEGNSHEGEWKFTDSLGREVTFSGEIMRAAPSGNLAQQCLFAVAEDKTVGRSSKIAKNAVKYYGEDFANLPEFGTFYGAKADLNKEALIAADPQVIIDIGSVKGDMKTELDVLQEQLGIPVVFIEAELETMGQAFRTLGELLDCQDSANVIADYSDNTIADAKERLEKIKLKEKKSVYYGMNEDGLGTCADGSMHAQVIDLVGAENCAKIENAGSSAVEISFEQLLEWQPQVLLFWDSPIAESAADDALWQELDAVKNGEVYAIPSEPYNIIGNPPAANRIIGIKWLGNLLYPEIYDYDMAAEMKEFYKMLYHYELSDEEAAALLGR